MMSGGRASVPSGFAESLAAARGATLDTEVVVRKVSHRESWPRKQLPESRVVLEIERTGAVCPLSPSEITEWASKLGNRGADGVSRLRNRVTYWFYQASSLSAVWQKADQARVRDYFKCRLEQGDSPNTISLPPDFYRIDKWLPDISNRLSAIRTELLSLPGAVNTALRARFGGYDEALDNLATIPPVLNAIADAWHRPGRGQPSFKLMSGAVGLLTCAIEDYTGNEFPSPRSYKRSAEIELVCVLAARLFPSFTPAQIIENATVVIDGADPNDASALP